MLVMWPSLAVNTVNLYDRNVVYYTMNVNLYEYIYIYTHTLSLSLS